MKILHTSDWHIGLNFYGYDRLPEQENALSQIADIARNNDVDAIIVSGDVFHNPTPGAAAQRVLADALLNLRHKCPEAAIVITAGNHDSASRHEVYSAPWRELGINVIGTLPCLSSADTDDSALDRLITEVKGRGFIAAVPYVHERNMPDDLYTRLLQRVESRNPDGLPVVLSAHTTVSGCRFSGHEGASEKTVGGIDSVALSAFGSGFDYLALGHIHVPHTLRKHTPGARYCGTPLAVSFDEDFSHSVSIVTLTPGENPLVEEVAVNDLCPPVSVPADGFTDWDEGLRMLKDFPSDLPCYLRLNVEIDDFLPAEANAAIASALEGKACRFCRINARRKAASTTGESSRSYTLAEFQALSPLELAERYTSDAGIDFPDDLRTLFSEAVESIDNEAQNS